MEKSKMDRERGREGKRYAETEKDYSRQTKSR